MLFRYPIQLQGRSPNTPLNLFLSRVPVVDVEILENQDGTVSREGREVSVRLVMVEVMDVLDDL